MSKGMILLIDVSSFDEMQRLISECLDAGILRCTSPERTSLCDNPASSVFWQDAAEWYPCCEQHRIHGEQECGSTELSPHVLELVVVPDLAKEWLATLPSAKRDQIIVDEYDREE